MPYRIITHSGRAHIDELLAAALLSLHKGEPPCEVLRLAHKEVERLVENEEVPEDTYIIDCGMKFNPEKNLFDHHQSADMPSAALLMLKRFFPELEETALHDYFELVSDVDRYGENALSDSAHVSTSRDYWEFSCNLLLKSFEIEPTETLRLVSLSLKDRIEFEQVRNRAKIWLNIPGNMAVEDCGVLRGLIYINQPPADIVEGLHSVDAEIIKRENISFVYGFDKEDKNIRTLFRTRIGDPQLDFARSSPQKNIFAHQGGFLLRFSPANNEEWQGLIEQASLV